MFIDKEAGFKKQDYDLRQLRENYKDLQEYLREDIALIAKKYRFNRANLDFEQQKEIEDTQDLDKIEAYSRTTKRYLYELSIQEATKNYQNLYRIIEKLAKNFKSKRVLDFGAGIGGLPIFLNKHGLQTDYLDVPGKTYQCAKFRLKKRGIKLALLIPDSYIDYAHYYDLITSFECFEHIYDLKNTLLEINKMLKPGGHLLSISTFRGGGDHLPKNYCYNNINEFNKLAGRCGFKFVGYFIKKFNMVIPGLLINLAQFIFKRLRETSGHLIIYQKNE